MPLKASTVKSGKICRRKGRAREVAGFVGARVQDEQGNEFEVSTVEAAPRDAVSVRLLPRHQRPGRRTETDKRAPCYSNGERVTKNVCAREQIKRPRWLCSEHICGRKSSR